MRRLILPILSSTFPVTGWCPGERHSRLSRPASGSHFPDFKERSLLPEGVSFMCLHSGLSSTHGLRVLRAICLWGCALVTLSPAYGQSTAEWLTSSADPARDAWQHGESKITTKTSRKLQLLWKTRVESKTMGMQSFREPLIVSGVKTADGARTVVIVAGASNEVFAF